MNDIRSVPAQKYHASLADAIKESGDFEAPQWILLVKSGAAKQRPSTDPDFWYKRAASILRQFYVRGVIGVERLRTRYGSRKNKGMKPAKFMKSGGKMIRTILQQAETAGYLEKVVGKRSGRQLTKKGKEFMEQAIKHD